MSQRNKFKSVVYLLLFIIAVSGLSWLFFYNSAVGRDYERLADIKVIQGQLDAYYAQYNTYLIPDCQPNSVLDACLGKDGRKINFSNLKDPLNSGSYKYIIYSLADTDYQIGFGLEMGIGGLAPGGYILTKDGVKQ